MLLPACTGTGLPTLVIERSAESATRVFTLALLFPLLGSEVDDETVSVCVIVDPAATVVLTLSTSVKVAEVLAFMFAESAQIRVARLQVHVPPGPVSDTAVVPAGRESLNCGVAAAAGPALVTTCVYVMLLPAVTGFGLPEFMTLRSACPAAATPITTVAELLDATVSRVVVPTVAVSVIVPVTPVLTL